MELLGKGAYGEVLLAKKDNTFYAIKRIKLKNKTVTKLTTAEIRILKYVSSFGNPHLQEYIEFFQERDIVYIVLRYIQGRTLLDYITLKKDDSGVVLQLSVAQKIDISLQLMYTLQFLHDNGLLHRDIKPANIMVHIEHDRPHITLVDYGLSCMLSNHKKKGIPACDFSKSRGTPTFMSPDVFRRSVDSIEKEKASDIFACAVTIYMLFTNRRPWSAKTVEELKTQIILGKYSKRSTSFYTLDTILENILAFPSTYFTISSQQLIDTLLDMRR